MNNLRKYSSTFFDQLEIFEDVSRGHNYKSFIRQAVIDFLENETKETALAVYTTFFDSYRIVVKDNENSFLDLLDILQSYEENAATLIDKQRDHYIHSVNVFIVGLCFYIQNSNFRDAFNQKILDKSKYPYSYDTKHEEFFYRWGLAALFHDIGYPVEIIGKQISKFIDLVTEFETKEKINPHLEFDNFDAFNSITEIIPKREFTRYYFEKFDTCIYIDPLEPLDLLAHQLHLDLGINLKSIKNSLTNFVNIMAKNGFIDHGFYSAIIILKWYGYLIQRCDYKPEYFFYPVLDSASAILLHNYYRNVLLKPPYSLKPLSPETQPIAFLLILCDELQEWNRKAFGIIDKKRNQINEATINISDNRMDITYIVNKGEFPAQFSAEKEELFNNLLDLNKLFTAGYSIDCQILEEIKILMKTKTPSNQKIPRPLLENLEKMAIAIHQKYNQKQLESNPNQPLAYPKFSDLPDTLKYSNLRQARSISKLIDLMGWEILPINNEHEEIVEFSSDEVEILAKIEHDEWVHERQENGWVYGETKNVDKKISPYLVPYESLTQEIKELDRNSVRNIPELLHSIGMCIYKRKSFDK